MWGLGCVLHYMAALEHPFMINLMSKGGHHISRSSIEYNILTGTPNSLPESYSNRLKIVIQRLLEKDPSKRLTANELINLIPPLEETVITKTESKQGVISKLRARVN